MGSTLKLYGSDRFGLVKVSHEGKSLRLISNHTDESAISGKKLQGNWKIAQGEPKLYLIHPSMQFPTNITLGACVLNEITRHSILLKLAEPSGSSFIKCTYIEQYE